MRHLEKRVVVALAVGLLVLVQAGLAGVAFFARRQTEQRLDVESGRVDSQRLELQRAAQRAEQHLGHEVAAPSLRWQLLEHADVAGTMQILQAVGDASHVVFDQVKAMQSNTAGKQSFLIAGRGSPLQVCEFLAALEQNDRLLVIETGRMLPGGEDAIAFEIGLATYHSGVAK